MSGDVDLAATAGLLADPARVRFLLSLGGGRSLPARDLARAAGISPPAASFHLRRLVAAGLLQVEARGRERWFRLADPRVERVLETLAEISPRRAVHSLRQSQEAEAIQAARICDGHLAGDLGVALADACVDRGLLDSAFGSAYLLTAAGASLLAALGVDGPLQASQPVSSHPDWSGGAGARHLAGPVADALTRRLLELRWLDRRRRSRAVHVTDRGRRELRARFGVAA